jgi:adenylate cyclase
MKGFCVVLFVDIAGSTSLYEALGDAEAHRAVTATLRRLQQTVAAQGGLVIKTIGDELMCRFAKASDALLAAEAMQTDQVAQGGNLGLRIAFHAGEVLHHEGDLFGDAVNLAARLAALAKPGQILLSQATADLLDAWMRHTTRTVGSATVKGRLQPVDLVEALWDRSAELTLIDNGPAASASARGHRAAPRLELRVDGQRHVLDAQHPRLTFGRDEANDLVIIAAGVSRLHGRIECKGAHFHLQDLSSNGTVVRRPDGLDTLLRRNEHILQGSGTIQCGPQDSPCIEYVCG